MSNLIQLQASLASRAGLTDADLTRIIQSGCGGWLRGIAKRVDSGHLPEAVAINLIAARADALALSAAFLLALALPLKAFRMVLQ
jgi:hypothetical protein